MASLDFLLVFLEAFVAIGFCFSGQQAVREEINSLVKFSKQLNLSN